MQIPSKLSQDATKRNERAISAAELWTEAFAYAAGFCPMSFVAQLHMNQVNTLTSIPRTQERVVGSRWREAEAAPLGNLWATTSLSELPQPLL